MQWQCAFCRICIQMIKLSIASGTHRETPVAVEVAAVAPEIAAAADVEAEIPGARRTLSLS